MGTSVKCAKIFMTLRGIIVYLKNNDPWKDIEGCNNNPSEAFEQGYGVAIEALEKLTEEVHARSTTNPSSNQ